MKMANVCDLYIGNYELRKDIDEMRRQMNILLLEKSILEIQLERCIQNMAEQRKEVKKQDENEEFKSSKLESRR